MQFSEAQQALARKLDIDYADIANNDLFTSTDLGDFVQTGIAKAWDSYPWAFTEGDWTSTTTADGYNDYPSDCEDESIERLYIADEEYRKVKFADYQKFLMDNPDSTERIWSEHKRFYFYNTNADTVGSEVWFTGKKRASTLSADSDLLPFSPTTDNQENSGNRAIIELAYAEALNSEKLKNYGQGQAAEKRGYGILAAVWEPIAARRSAEQSQDRPFSMSPTFSSLQTVAASAIGNFDL